MDLSESRGRTYERHRRELGTYATRMVWREDIAEELVQEAAVRLLRDEHLPDDDPQIRAWLFRVVTNLAIDHLRRHSTWKEMVLLDIRDRAEADSTYVAESLTLRGSSVMAAIAREHLAVCFARTLRNLPPQQAAALLLRDVHGFSIAEAAAALEATSVQDHFFNGEQRAVEEFQTHGGGPSRHSSGHSSGCAGPLAPADAAAGGRHSGRDQLNSGTCAAARWRLAAGLRACGIRQAGTRSRRPVDPVRPAWRRDSRNRPARRPADRRRSRKPSTRWRGRAVRPQAGRESPG